ASKTAAVWVDDPHGAMALTEDAGLWGSAPGMAPELNAQLGEWMEVIGDEIQVMGAQLKGRAKAASISLNVLGTSAILAVFIHTGGLTGAEIGIGAATAILNQKLLEAIFGEANVAAFVDQARASLDRILDSVFTAEQERFIDALGPMAQATDLAADLRRAAHAAARTEPH
ncbi:MAG: hypothetical protein ACRDU7_02100, partial [Acidimicrobiia bacterium]